MASIEIRAIGTEKAKVIVAFQEITGCEPKEALEVADSIEAGNIRVLDGLSDSEVEEISNILEMSGAVITVNKTANDNLYASNKKNLIQNSERYQPIVASNEISMLDREGTIAVLEEVKKIALEHETYFTKIEEGEKDKKEILAKAKKMQGEWSKVGGITILIGGGVLLLSCWIFFGFIIGLIFAAVLWFAFAWLVDIIDVNIHKSENDAKAKAYIEENMPPIQASIDEVYVELEKFNQCGKKDWAVDVVGEELFYSTCIDDLCSLIKSRRADSLKEALNLYDDTKYKERMEEMQKAIQTASEGAAKEAAKQTALSQQIEKNSHEAAIAAKATAYHTKQISKNTRRFR